MQCPTCNHDTEDVGRGGPPMYWCPRCGMRIEWGVRYVRTTMVPLLVDACRAFEDEGGPARVLEFWTALGIPRAIHLPKDRLTPPRKAA